MTISRTTAAYILVAIGLAALGACTTQPVSRPVDIQSLEARAQSEEQAGNLASAAALYRELAQASGGTLRAGYLIEGARIALRRGDAVTASSWLTEARAGADREQQAAIDVLLARLALDMGDAVGALATLDSLPESLPVPVLRDSSEVRGRALFALGRYADGVRQFIDREIWLDDAAEILANQHMLWDLLAGAQILPGAAPTGDPTVDGWLALAPVARAGADDADFRRLLLDWRRTYVDHPAAGVLLAELLKEQRQGDAVPAKIALLLPLNSPQRTQALAVRDGFLAAHVGSTHMQDTAVAIYDTAIAGAASAYLQAQLDGADFIVGPLLQPNVEQVMSQSGFIPTLALNFSQTDTAFLQSFYQFGLAPEDEARAIADQAIAAGRRTALALVASDDRGYRILNSFRAEFEALGGVVLASAGYVPDGQDVAGAITSLLNLSRSEQRHRRLQANLGINLTFEPRRRQDVDMIFLQANSQMGRLLAPNLRFYYAGDIPTYATSEIYEPGSPAGDGDLNGIIFPDVPLLLTPDLDDLTLTGALEDFWPQRATQYIRLYGLGYDAYRLVPTLYHSDSLAWPIMGTSGRLDLDALGRIHRTLPFGQFRDGRPVAIAPVPEPTGERSEFFGSR